MTGTPSKSEIRKLVRVANDRSASPEDRKTALETLRNMGTSFGRTVESRGSVEYR
jgi:hypothetical protein